MVSADPTALNLMLNNLIDNAIRYSKEPHHLTIAGRAQNGAVTLEVTDKGVGIPEEDLPRVTRKFWRGRIPCAAAAAWGWRSSTESSPTMAESLRME